MSRYGRLLLLLPLLLLLFACDTGEGMDLRLFCQRYSQAAETQARLRPEQFLARPRAGGFQYEAFLEDQLLLTLEALPDGRVHTIALTALPETPQLTFRRMAVAVLHVYCGVAYDAAERRLNEVNAGAAELPGYQTRKENGFRLSYAANAVGRYLRVSQLRFLPEEPPLPTLKDWIPTEAQPPLIATLPASTTNEQGE